jgi:hypothetical protein
MVSALCQCSNQHCHCSSHPPLSAGISYSNESHEQQASSMGGQSRPQPLSILITLPPPTTLTAQQRPDRPPKSNQITPPFPYCWPKRCAHQTAQSDLMILDITHTDSLGSVWTLHFVQHHRFYNKYSSTSFYFVLTVCKFSLWIQFLLEILIAYRRYVLVEGVKKLQIFWILQRWETRTLEPFWNSTHATPESIGRVRSLQVVLKKSFRASHNRKVQT